MDETEIEYYREHLIKYHGVAADFLPEGEKSSYGVALHNWCHSDQPKDHHPDHTHVSIAGKDNVIPKDQDPKQFYWWQHLVDSHAYTLDATQPANAEAVHTNIHAYLGDLADHIHLVGWQEQDIIHKKEQSTGKPIYALSPDALNRLRSMGEIEDVAYEDQLHE